MSAEWGLALRIGAVGFALVFVILALLYVALSITGRFATRLASARSKAPDKQAMQVQQDRVSAAN